MSKETVTDFLNTLPAELQAQCLAIRKKREEELPTVCEMLRDEFERRCKESGVTLSLVFNRGKTWSRKGNGTKKKNKNTEVQEAA